jgi:hypothetical protein
VHEGFHGRKMLLGSGKYVDSFSLFHSFESIYKNPLSRSRSPSPSHIPHPIPRSTLLSYLLATAQAPISRFFAGPEVGEMSKSKISIGKPNVMHAFGI